MIDQTILRMPFRRVPLWAPEVGGRFGKAELEAARAAHLRSFQRGFQQMSLTDEELLFRHFSACLDFNLTLAQVWAPHWELKVGGVDLSSERRPGTCVFILGLSPEWKRVPVHVEYMPGSGPELVERLWQLWQQHRMTLWMVEDNAIQDSVISWCHAMHASMNVMATTTTANKRDPETGLAILDVEFSQRSWLIPWGGLPRDGEAADSKQEKDWCRWRDELAMYPGHATSDGVMATWFAQQGARFVEFSKVEGIGQTVTEDDLQLEEPWTPNLGDY